MGLFFLVLMFSNYKVSVSVIGAEEGVTYVSFSEATATDHCPSEIM